MRHTMVTYTVTPGREEENAVFYLPDPRQFIHLYTDEGSTSGVQELASFQAFVTGAKDRHEQPATSTQPELVGDYRTFDDRDRRSAADGRFEAR